MHSRDDNIVSIECTYTCILKCHATGNLKPFEFVFLLAKPSSTNTTQIHKAPWPLDIYHTNLRVLSLTLSYRTANRKLLLQKWMEWACQITIQSILDFALELDGVISVAILVGPGEHLHFVQPRVQVVDLANQHLPAIRFYPTDFITSLQLFRQFIHLKARLCSYSKIAQSPKRSLNDTCWPTTKKTVRKREIEKEWSLQSGSIYFPALTPLAPSRVGPLPFYAIHSNATCSMPKHSIWTSSW